MYKPVLDDAPISRVEVALLSTPGPHNDNPRHKIFATGWVAPSWMMHPSAVSQP